MTDDELIARLADFALFLHQRGREGWEELVMAAADRLTQLTGHE